ncbi:MAG: flagellar export protein FliJ [Phycisphaeraceae bacterium]
MPAFRFKFESVLEHRRRVEDECQRELAQHLRGRMILQNQLGQMQGTIQQAKHELGDALVGRVDLDRVSGFARYSGHSTDRAMQIVRRMARMEKQITEARQRLLEATRERKAIELLRDQHARQWERDRQRRDAIALDELATQQYLRQAAMGGEA